MIGVDGSFQGSQLTVLTLWKTRPYFRRVQSSGSWLAQVIVEFYKVATREGKIHGERTNEKPADCYSDSVVISNNTYSQIKRVNTIRKFWGNESDVLLIDSRASEHVVADSTMFDTIERISPQEADLSERYSTAAWYKAQATAMNRESQTNLSNMHHISEL